jgi:8-amino-7-oxononanoate synthase
MVEAFTRPGSTVHVVIDGRRLVSFCGNDYLGLAREPRVAAALAGATGGCGVGTGASHLISGHGREHASLEGELATFTGRERALLFSTGYMANLAVVSTLAGRGDLVLLDRLSHASLIDAALLSRARLRRYPHRNAEAAGRMLRERSGPAGALLVTDGVFSMDGDVAPAEELASLAHAHAATLVVDDAHGLGVIGASGRGTLEQLDLDARAVPVLVGTLGKAFGTFGAFVAGSAELIEGLVQRARTYIYTTALPQPVAAATRAALKLAQEESWRRTHVLALTARFREAAQARGIALADSRTPIQPIILGSAESALEASERLLEAGVWVAAIRPPTVPAGASRLRITFSAAHSEDEVDTLVRTLDRILPDEARA